MSTTISNPSMFHYLETTATLVFVATSWQASHPRQQPSARYDKGPPRHRRCFVWPPLTIAPVLRLTLRAAILGVISLADSSRDRSRERAALGSPSEIGGRPSPRAVAALTGRAMRVPGRRSHLERERSGIEVPAPRNASLLAAFKPHACATSPSGSFALMSGCTTAALCRRALQAMPGARSSSAAAPRRNSSRVMQASSAISLGSPAAASTTPPSPPG